MILLKKISIIFQIMLILIFLSQVHIHPLPLTETCYIIPDGEIEFLFQEQLHKLNNFYRAEQISLGFGIIQNLSMTLYSQLLHQGSYTNGNKTAIGDSFMKISYFLGRYYHEIINLGLIIKFRFPTGEDSYIDNRWGDINFGKNELKIGPVARLKLNRALNIHMSLFYLMRESENESFYSGFKVNLIRLESYKSFFGFNPYAEGAFFEKKRLMNDYFIFNIAINTEFLLPVLPFIEIQFSRRVRETSRPAHEHEPLPLNSEPILISAGSRYFFSLSNYLGLYGLINPADSKKNLKWLIGIEGGLLF